MRPISITQQVTDSAVDDGICESQTTAGAGALLIDGVFATGGVATLDTARQVLFTSGGDLSAITFTVTGTNNTGTLITEDILGPDTSTAGTITGFLTVTSVVADAAVGTAVIVGTSIIAFSDPVPMDQYISPFAASIALSWTGLSNDAVVTVQFTFDSVFDSTGPYEWTDHDDLTSQTQANAPVSGSLISPVSAVRLVTDDGTGEVIMNILQAGLT
ncbi:hypothetical protein KAR91_82860 [Candidatus Pacearchaeota archaeon]|nr:hypothetical protein [Candidatus Pacearchaeota archaeon]